MNIQILDKENEKQVKAFLEVKNAAFLARSNERVPYTKRTEEDLRKKLSVPDTRIYIMQDDGHVLGGVGCCYWLESGI